MFKLAPTVHDASVCLRCDYRGLTRKRPRSSLSRPPNPGQQLRLFIPPPSLYQEQARAQATSVDGSSNGASKIKYYRDGPGGENSFVHERQSDGNEEAPLRIRYEPIGFNSGETPRLSRNLYPHSKDPLGVDALGEPADVLIIPSTKPHGARAKALWSENPRKNPPVSAAATSPAKLLDEIHGELGIINGDQACSNIDSVKESWLDAHRNEPGAVPAADYDDLASKLRAGFTVKQLRSYLERPEWGNIMDASDLFRSYSTPLYARSRWTAGETPLTDSRAPKISKSTQVDTAGQHLRPETLPGGGPQKNRLADLIIQRCWHIRRESEDPALGEIDLRLQQIHFDLILNHKRAILKKLSETYGVKIEASRSYQAIRITSDIYSCGDVIRLFTYTLENMRHTQFDLSPHQLDSDGVSVVERPIDTAFLQQIERLTNTVIKPIKRSADRSIIRNGLIVYYLGPEQADLEDAKRLLTKNLSAESFQESKLIWGVKPSSSMTVLAPIDVGTSLPLADRNSQWSRWCTPETRKIDVVNSNHPHPTINASRCALDRHSEAFRDVTDFLSSKKETGSNYYSMPRNLEDYWAPSLIYNSRVQLGQIIFPTSVAQKAEKRLQRRASRTQQKTFAKSMAVSRRELLTSVQGMVHSLEILKTAKSDLESLWIRMSPSLALKLPSGLAKALPSLELRVNINNRLRTTSFAMARLVVADSALDVLLPQHTMDLRFARRTHVFAKRFDPRLQDFVDASNLDIWGQERLRTPSNLSILIPAYSIRNFEMFDQLLFTQGLPVDYTFVGLEHRSELHIPYRETQEINFTTVEAGRTGGRREELLITHAKQSEKSDSKKLQAMAKHSERKSDSSINGGEEEKMSSEKKRARSLVESTNALIGDMENPEAGKRHQTPDILRKHWSEDRDAMT